MKTLNIIKIENGTPQIIEAFVFYDGSPQSEAEEIKERAEYRFCKLVMGPGYKIETTDEKRFQRLIIEGYDKGILITEPEKGKVIYSLHLSWCEISNP